MCKSFGGNQGVARVVIASTSLSMGVDFPTVKYVIHFGPGRTITEHLQQAGRAGRDSSPAFNIVMYQGKHTSQCDQSMRDIIESHDCIRHLLLKDFVDGDLESVAPLHNCCSKCHLKCKCSDGECAEAIPIFDEVHEDSTTDFSTAATRTATEDD